MALGGPCRGYNTYGECETAAPFSVQLQLRDPSEEMLALGGPCCLRLSRVRDHVLPQAWAMLVTCELATSSSTQVWPKPAQGPSLPLVPLELVCDTLPYGKKAKTSMFRSHARGPLDVGPAPRDRIVEISIPLDARPGGHAQLDPGDSATSPEEVSWCSGPADV